MCVGEFPIISAKNSDMGALSIERVAFVGVGQ